MAEARGRAGAGAASVSAALGGADTTILATTTDRFTNILMGQPDVAPSAESVRGRTVAVTRYGASSDFVARYWLRRLGLDSPEKIADAGIRVMKMSMPIPFHPSTIRRFARGLQELFVIEEMNPTLERWIREALYHETERPIITGKNDPDGQPLLPASGMLDADRIVAHLRSRLTTRLADRLAPLAPRAPASPRAGSDLAEPIVRPPFTPGTSGRSGRNGHDGEAAAGAWGVGDAGSCSDRVMRPPTPTTAQ